MNAKWPLRYLFLKAIKKQMLDKCFKMATALLVGDILHLQIVLCTSPG